MRRVVMHMFIPRYPQHSDWLITLRPLGENWPRSRPEVAHHVIARLQAAHLCRPDLLFYGRLV